MPQPRAGSSGSNADSVLAVFDPAAAGELANIKDGGEVKAIMNVVDKLAALGLRLGYPHSSSVEGEAGEGLRELRPRAGSSAFRPIYRRFGGYWVILAIAHKGTYDRAVADAQARAAAYPR